MGRAYWPRPARAGQAYVLEASIGQAARELRVPCVSRVCRGGDGAGRVRPVPGKQREKWRGVEGYGELAQPPKYLCFTGAPAVAMAMTWDEVTN